MTPPLFLNQLGNLHNLTENIYLSASELRQKVQERMAIYRTCGLKPGEFVILAHGNNHFFFMDLLALWELGLCCIPVDPQLSLPELVNLARHSGSRALIYRQAFQISEFQAIFGPEVLVLDTEALPQSPNSVLFSPPSPVTWDAPALLLYTSGSTGEPKGVLHSFRSLMARLYLLRPYVDLAKLKTSLNLLPTHFGHGLICNCLYPLLHGQTLIIMPPFNLENLQKLGEILVTNQVSFMSSVPALWKLALKLSRPPSQTTLALVHCGSAPFSAELRQKIQAWTGCSNVKNTYGITETGSWLAGSEDNLADFCDGYIGPGWGSQFQVLSPESEPCDPKEVGLVYVQTPALMQGYYQRPDLSALAIQNTWFATGDLGYLDSRGSLVLVGRQRHEINKAGMKIYPEDLDLALERNPWVQEACTFGYADPIAGQNIGVALVLKASDKLEVVKTWLATQISPHKMPTKWFTLENLPKTSRGKINREQIAAQVLGSHPKQEQPDVE